VLRRSTVAVSGARLGDLDRLCEVMEGAAKKGLPG
jgi:hypothetical protein